MNKKEVKISPCMEPLPQILVSCRGLDGKNNALAVAYCCNCSYDPPMLMVGIVPSRHSYKMIKESECFVVNLVSKDYKDVFEYLGSHSGRDEDKLSKMNVSLSDGIKVNAPILSDCPVNIECRVVDSILTGSHEMFVGKIEYVHADSKLVTDEGEIDSLSLSLL